MLFVEVVPGGDRVVVAAERVAVVRVDLDGDDLLFRVILGDDEEHLVAHLPHVQVRRERPAIADVLERGRGVAGVSAATAHRRGSSACPAERSGVDGTLSAGQVLDDEQVMTR